MSQVSSSYILNAVGSFDNWHLVQREISDLSETQVLIKMECSTINPSDYQAILGRYPISKLPTFTGGEGSGTVVKTGSSEKAQSLLNKRVAVISPGAWGEFNVAEAGAVFELQDHVSFEQAADFVVNPMTVAYMIELTQNKNSSFVYNASASALGQQLTRLATRLGIKHICIVRKNEQVEILRKLGAEHVFNTSEPGWIDQAKKVAAEIAPKIAFDAIGGAETAVLAQLIENGGVVYNYGGLSGQSPQLSSLQLIFQQKTLTGLWLAPYLLGKNEEGKRELGLFVQKHIDILANEYNIETDLNGLKNALEQYIKNPTGNKVLVRTRIN
jgi:NADPH:quinone reductase-like Zn-dependent oxidoreductase